MSGGLFAAVDMSKMKHGGAEALQLSEMLNSECNWIKEQSVLDREKTAMRICIYAHGYSSLERAFRREVL